MDLTSIDFGDRKVIINEDSFIFIIEYKGMYFRFDNSLCVDKLKIDKFFQNIDILLEYCTFGTNSICDDCRSSEYYYNTKRLIFYTPNRNFVDFELNNLTAYIILAKHGEPGVVNSYYYFNCNDRHCTYVLNDDKSIEYPIYFPDDIFNDYIHYKTAVEDYFTIIKILEDNDLLDESTENVRINMRIHRFLVVNYGSKRIILNTIFIRPKLQHILDELQSTKLPIDE